MNEFKLRVGDELFIGPESWKVASLDDFKVALRNRTSRKPRVLDWEEVRRLHARQELAVPARRLADAEAARLKNLEQEFAMFSLAERTRAREIFLYIRVLDLLPHGERGVRLPDAIQQVADSLGQPPAGISSVYRWWRFWVRHGRRVQALIPLIRRRGNRTCRLHPTVVMLLEAAIDEALTVECPPIASAYRALAAAIQHVNDVEGLELPCPSLRAVYRRFLKRDGFQVVALRKGRSAARRVYRSTKAAPNTTTLNEVWEVDHTWLDIFIYDDATGCLLGRPWITAIIDRHTRVVVGFYIGFEPPSYVSVMLALRHALQPKDYVQARYPRIRFAYPFAGKQQLLKADRGLEFKGGDLADALFQLAIDLDLCPPRSPWYKAMIERWFLTLRLKFLQLLPGSVGGENARNSAAGMLRASIGYAEFVEIFHHWLIDDYHQSLHAGLGMPPAMAWDEALKREGGLIPREIPTAEELRCLTGYTVRKKPQTYGLKWNHLVWNSPRLSTIRSVEKGGAEVTFKVDPLNLDTVWFYDPVCQKWLEAASQRPDYTKGLTFFQHRAIMRHTRERVGEWQRVNGAEMLRSRHELLELLRAYRPEKIGDQRRMLRFFMQARDGMAGVVQTLSEAEAAFAVPDFEEFGEDLCLPDLISAANGDGAITAEMRRPPVMAVDPTRG